jgi:hypothetical protein
MERLVSSGIAASARRAPNDFRASGGDDEIEHRARNASAPRDRNGFSHFAEGRWIAGPAPSRTSSTSRSTSTRTSSTSTNKITAPTSAPRHEKEDEEMARLDDLERQIRTLTAGKAADEVRALVARHEHEIPAELHSFARGLDLKSARAFVEGYRVAAKEDGRGEFGITRADADKLDCILGIMPSTPRGEKPGTFGAFDATRGARPFITHTVEEVRAMRSGGRRAA